MVRDKRTFVPRPVHRGASFLLVAGLLAAWSDARAAVQLPTLDPGVSPRLPGPASKSPLPPIGLDNWGFEHGLTGWEKTGDAFNHQPTFGDNVTMQRVTHSTPYYKMPLGGDYWKQLGFPIGHKGARWIGTYERRPSNTGVTATQGDGPRGGQFDILTPGGGVGLFDACSFQWDVATPELGATYGGFMTHCQQRVGGDHQQLKQCVLSRCAAVFDEPGLAELAAGCEWYVQWYEVADNPNLRYQEVACPAELLARSGIDRGPLDDIAACEGGGGGTCTQQQMDRCDCAGTNNGQNCGRDDGSCCWSACCG